MVKVLFVCLGNICRSPAAEGLLRHMVKSDPLLKDIHIESCGLGDWHIGQLPDERMREASKARGIVLASRAQKFVPAFFDQFDYILVADNEVLHDLRRVAKTPEHKAKIQLMTAFSSSYTNEEIPDPYYKGEAGFEQVMDMLEDVCQGFIDYLRTSKSS